MAMLEGIPTLLVAVFAKWVEVAPDSAGKERNILADDSLRRQLEGSDHTKRRENVQAGCGGPRDQWSRYQYRRH